MFKIEIHHLDVGQGEATIIIASNGLNDFYTVIDGGRLSRGGGTLLGHLRTLGTQIVHRIILTHFDNDHAEGLLPLLGCEMSKNADVFCEPMIGSLDSQDDLDRRFYKLAATRLKKPQVGDVHWLTNSTSGPYLKFVQASIHGNDKNAKSIGTLIVFEDFRYYTAGDLPWQVEDELPSVLKQHVKGGVDHVCAFKAGHHGADTSSSKKFIEAIKPRVAFISCGMHRHSHPAQNTINTLHEQESIRATYLTNCFYNRKWVNPDFGMDMQEDVKAHVGGDKEHLGHIILSVNQTQAKKHEFDVYFWRDAGEESSVAAHNWSCLGTTGTSKLVPEGEHFFSIERVAGKLKPEDLKSSEEVRKKLILPVFKTWKGLVVAQHATAKFSQKDGVGGSTGKTELSENYEYEGMDLEEIEGIEDDNKLHEQNLIKSKDRRAKKSEKLVEHECLICKERLAVHESSVYKCFKTLPEPHGFFYVHKNKKDCLRKTYYCPLKTCERSLTKAF